MTQCTEQCRNSLLERFCLNSKTKKNVQYIFNLLYRCLKGRKDFTLITFCGFRLNSLVNFPLPFSGCLSKRILLFRVTFQNISFGFSQSRLSLLINVDVKTWQIFMSLSLLFYNRWKHLRICHYKLKLSTYLRNLLWLNLCSVWDWTHCEKSQRAGWAIKKHYKICCKICWITFNNNARICDNSAYITFRVILTLPSYCAWKRLGLSS